MCHTIELIGGIADGQVFELHETPPRALVVWAEIDGDRQRIHVIDFDDDETVVPEEAHAVVYRRRWAHVHRLTLPQEVVVPLPYDLVREHAGSNTFADQHT